MVYLTRYSGTGEKHIIITIDKVEQQIKRGTPFGVPLIIYHYCGLIYNQILTCHVGRLLKSHDVQDRGSHVGKATVLHCSRVVVGDIDEGHGVE